MNRTDYKKTLNHLYRPSSEEAVIIDVPPLNFLMIDGSGNPNISRSYREALEALYAVAYSIKFNIKKTQGLEYVVMPLEGLWWANDMDTFITRNKDAWHWTMMIMQPESVTKEFVEEALVQVEKKKNPAALGKLRFESYHEGLSVHIMHIGSYDEEGPTITRMHDFAREQGYQLRGKHHEIYLGDPRKTKSEKLMTILRQPIEK